MRESIAPLALALFAALASGAEKPLAWPQFRGPNGSGVADGQKPPVEFGPDKNVKWKVPVPAGLSSPIVAGDNLVLTAFEKGKLYTIAYWRKDGKEAWRAEAPAKEVEPFHKAHGSPASSTPVTDGKRIISYFGSCGLFCYGLDGKELWRYKMPTASTNFHFGTGTSPVLADGLVVVVREDTGAPKIVAVNAKTGKLAWEKKRDSFSAFCTPVIWDTVAGKQVVVAGFGRMIGYDLKSGDEKWTVPGMPSAACASPVVAGGTLYFAGWSPGKESLGKLPSFDEVLKDVGETKLGHLTKAGWDRSKFGKELPFKAVDLNKDGKLTREEWKTIFRLFTDSKSSAFALKPGGKGDVTKTHMLWKQEKGLPYIASAIVYRGQLVTVKDNGLVTAFNAKTGKEVYVQKRAVAIETYYASPVAANGHIYFTSLESGLITVLKAGADKPTVVARNPKLGERTAATPTIADNALYVRTAGHLYKFAEKE
jgi:outer membrane protein assembly factor BamB